MNLLIAGVNGFVGKNLFRYLSKNHTVYGIYNSGEPLSENCYKLNLTNEKAAFQLFSDKFYKNIDTVIHLASRMADSNNTNDISVLTDNVIITKNLAVACKNSRVKHIINLSSSSVYPNIDGLFNEDSIIDPSRNSDFIYGLSKFNSEVILNYFLKDTGIKLTHLRAAMLHGNGMNQTRIIPMFEKELDEDNKITLYGNGERLLNLISIEKLCAYLDFFIKNPMTDVINISEETVSTADIAKRIIGERGNNNSVIKYKPEGNKYQFRLDTSKLQGLLNY